MSRSTYTTPYRSVEVCLLSVSYGKITGLGLGSISLCFLSGDEEEVLIL